MKKTILFGIIFGTIFAQYLLRMLPLAPISKHVEVTNVFFIWTKKGQLCGAASRSQNREIFFTFNGTHDTIINAMHSLRTKMELK